MGLKMGSMGSISKLDGRRAYSLLELLVVLNIIAILASLAYPAYVSYKVRVNRADVQAQMHQIAARLQQHQFVYQHFENVTLLQLGYANQFPQQQAAYFDLILETKRSSWILRAHPKENTIQENNGTLALNHLGQSCWEKGQICEPKAQSNWNNNR